MERFWTDWRTVVPDHGSACFDSGMCYLFLKDQSYKKTNRSLNGKRKPKL